MTTQINWQIEWMRTTPGTASPPECVIEAGWRCNGAGAGYTSTVYSTCAFPAPSDPFIPYEDLTEAQVLDWVWANGVDKAEVELSVQQQIDAQVAPPVIQPPLPWA